MGLKQTSLALVAWVGLAVPGSADTLADVQQDLAVLQVELNRLKVELSTTGATSLDPAGGGASDRISSIERALQRLTGKTEELEFRIEGIVKDGTNRIGDLQFRVCELDPSCDFGDLGKTVPLGGATAEEQAEPRRAAPVQAEEQLAVGEEADFGRAQEALASGDFRSAATQFETFGQTYPGSPLESRALLGLGQALQGQGDTRAAARAYLEAYSGFPQDATAPEALFRLGAALGDLGAVSEACVTLGQVEVRYPQASAVPDAREAMAGLGCL